MDFAFSTLGNLEWPVEKFAAELAAVGYNSVEIRGKQGAHVGPEDSSGRRKEIRDVFEKAGLRISTLSGYCSFVDRSAHDANLAALKSYVDLASDIGAGFVRTFGGDLLDGQSPEDATDAVALALEQIIPAAEKANIVVVLETHDGFSRSRMVRAVLDKVQSPFIKALWDIHHPFRHGESWSGTYDILRDGLGYLHIKDAFLMPDGSEQLCLLGAGRIPVKEIVRQLRDDNFLHPIVVEWEGAWHPELPDCSIAIPQHIHKLNSYLSEE